MKWCIRNSPRFCLLCPGFVDAMDRMLCVKILARKGCSFSSFEPSPLQCYQHSHRISSEATTSTATSRFLLGGLLQRCITRKKWRNKPGRDNEKRKKLVGESQERKFQEERQGRGGASERERKTMAKICDGEKRKEEAKHIFRRKDWERGSQWEKIFWTSCSSETKELPQCWVNKQACSQKVPSLLPTALVGTRRSGQESQATQLACVDLEFSRQPR